MIRPAQPTDYEAITAVRHELILDISKLDDPEYVAKVEQEGFLVPVDMPRSNFTEHISNFVVNEIDGKVVSFLRIEDEPEMDSEEVPHWVDPAMEAIYWEMPHAGIGKIAVSPSAGRRGIASDLLAEAERRSVEKGIHHLFSFIVACEPPTNYPSIRFHEKHGFSVAAPLDPQIAYGISDYRATLYWKQLS